MKKSFSKILSEEKKKNLNKFKVCESVAAYGKKVERQFKQLDLFANVDKKTKDSDIRVIELFAGVGGFRIGGAFF